jgi:hypothetical protein
VLFALLSSRLTSGCLSTSPPSINIKDVNLGLRSGTRYVQEWAVYPTSSGKSARELQPSCRTHKGSYTVLTIKCNHSSGGDYYSFINQLRQDRWGAVSTRLNGTGYLSMNTAFPNTMYSELENAGYSKPWGNWTAAEMETFLELQSMHFVTTDIPYVKMGGDPCRKGEDLYCHGNQPCITTAVHGVRGAAHTALWCVGSCFVNELPPVYDASMRQFAKDIKDADKLAGHAPRPNLVYMDTWLTTESNASSKYPDSMIHPPGCRPDIAGSCPEQAFEHCAAAPGGVVYPLFYGNTRIMTHCSVWRVRYAYSSQCPVV